MPSLNLLIPNYCTNEITYSFDVLFTCLGFSNYNFLVTNGLDDFVISTQDGKELIKITNHFFKKNMVYNESLIPDMVEDQVICVNNEKHHIIPLYGKASFIEDTFDLDIISSTFFMASRWEEKVKKERDIHGRFDETRALSVKSKFIHRPVINEYAMLFKAVLKEKGFDMGQTISNADIQITFDVDYIYKWKAWKSLIGNLVRKGPSVYDKFSYFRSFIHAKILKNYHADPFYSFDYILKVLEKYRSRSVFYFMVTRKNKEWDLNDYTLEDKPVREAINQIKANNHIVGLHSSYHAVESYEQISAEKSKMESSIKMQLEYIRPHFLRILPEMGFSTILHSGFKNESSMLYSRNFGFRCGCTFAIPYFDTNTSQKTGLMMVPTIAMSSVGIYQNFISQKKVVKNLIETMRKYGGQAQIIWHNSDVDTAAKKKYFEEVMEMIYVSRS